MYNDVLADVLSVGQLGSKIICRPGLIAPWGMHFDIERRSMLHIVRRGSCWVRPTKRAAPIRLMRGDLAFFSECRGHTLSSDRVGKTGHFIEVSENHKRRLAARETEPENLTRLFCGTFQLAGDIALPFFSLFPHFIHIRADEIQADASFERLIHLIIAEDSQERMGSHQIQSLLLDALLIYIVRYWVRNSPDPSAGWLFALRDPNIAKALSFMHSAPAQKWTVEDLAERVFMSRASFARRFHDLVGRAPLTYLTGWRMDLAARLLRDSGFSMTEISRRVGYESETSFNKAFKKYREVPPGEYRQKHRRLVESDSGG